MCTSAKRPYRRILFSRGFVYWTDTKNIINRFALKDKYDHYHIDHISYY